MVQVWKGSETFFFKRGDAGCLLLHGGTGTPAVMRPMGEFLVDRGISVLGVRLKGYATSVEDWLRTTHLDWIGSAEEALEELRRDCKSVVLAGLSMGGSLALYLAAKHGGKIAGVVPIGAPAGHRFLDDFRKKFLPLAMENLPQPNFSATDLMDTSIKPVGYDCHYPSVNLEWAKLVEKANLGLSAIRCPALIIQAANDHVIDPETARWIYENLGSEKKEVFWLRNSFHMATIDVDKELVFKKTVEFVRQLQR